MAYIGNIPAEKFTSVDIQNFTVSATANYTLDRPVANENEIELFINNVRQHPGSGKAYTASGTALTLSEATAGTDTMYCIYKGKARQTVTPANSSVTNDMLAGSIANSKLATDPTNASNLASGTVPTARLGSGTASSSTFLRGDSTFAAAGGDLSFGGDTFGADKTIGSNDNYALKFETNGTERLELTNDGRGLSQFTAKAWAVSNGTGTVAIIDSHNISSLADPESGQLVHNFANSMTNANYAIICNSWYGYSWTFGGMDMSTSSFKAVQSNGSSYQDSNRVSSLVFGD